MLDENEVRHRYVAQLPDQTSASLASRVRGSTSLRFPSSVVISSGAYLSEGLVLESDCHVGPNVAFCDGPPTTVKRGVWIGANATLYAGITLAANCVVQPGSVVTRSVPPGAIVTGNPAAIVGYVDAARSLHDNATTVRSSTLAGVEETTVRGVTIHNLPVIPDLRGNLTVGEFERQIPFEPRRYFVVYGVPSREVRGEHAHRQCHQFLVCLNGSCAVVADDGCLKVEVLLDAPHRGLYLPPMTWGVQYQYSADAILLVFASHHYDATDYIREYDEFLAAVARLKK
jgi:UDP-2-acetamido-3-amino-2,3-dideoxy-glucuronate N-acetyltransferase